MRLATALLVTLFAVSPAVAQNDDGGYAGSSQQVTGENKFRKASPARVKARNAARNTQSHDAHSNRGGNPAPKPTTLRKRPAAPATAVRREPAAPPPAQDGLLIQSELAWVGEYAGPINGDIDDRTVTAIKAFQRNRKFRDTGVLNTQERVLLATAAKARQAQVGWALVDDPVTGVKIGLPAKQIPNKSQGKTGTRWFSPQGQVQVETFRIPGTTLAAVFEQQQREPANRKVETQQSTPESFHLAGTQGLKKFHVRADVKDGEVRGMTVLYDPTEPAMDAVAVVMSNVFRAFPATTGAVQAAIAAPKRKVEYGTGLVASTAGHILTDRQLTEGCDVIVVSGYGNADLVAEDNSADLALIRVYGAPDLVPAPLGNDNARGTDAVLVGIADPQNQGGGSAISTTAAQLRGTAVEPAPQIGFTGAAALDRSNHFLGMAQLRPQVIANIGEPTLRSLAVMVPAPTIRAFLERQDLKAAGGEAGLETIKSSLVRVICVRK